MRNQIPRCSYWGCVLVLFLFSTSVFSQNVQPRKEITGTVTYLGAPLADVNITIAGSSRGANTDAKGTYSLLARPGDELKFSFVGFVPVTIIVEDITEVLNLEMTPKTNELETAVVKARSKVGTVLEFAAEENAEFESAVGKIDPKAQGHRMYYISGKELTPAALTLADALNGKRAGVFTPVPGSGIIRFTGKRGNAIWDIDGLITDNPPLIDIQMVEDIRIVRNGPVLARYGAIGAGGVIIVRTVGSLYGIDKKKETEKIAEKYRNQNFYQDDAVAIDSDTGAVDTVPSVIVDPDAPLRKVDGTITYMDAPLADVHISISGDEDRATKTNARGKYKIRARVGEEIVYSYVGFKTVRILVEDITSQLDISMALTVNELEEVVVTATTRKGEVLRQVDDKERTFMTSRGEFDPKKLGYDVAYVEGDLFSNTYLNIMEALEGKIANYVYDRNEQKAYIRGDGMSILNDYPVAWEVDGVFTTNPPTNLDLSQIESVRALKSIMATNKYGSVAAGGVILIQTKFGDYSASDAKRANLADKFTNKNYYANDASQWNEADPIADPFTEAIASYTTSEEAFAHYEDALKPDINGYGIHIAIAQTFTSVFGDMDTARSILMEQSNIHARNPEVLKSIAYQFQAFGLKKEAIAAYEQVMRLRPNYAQSYRDLANAYHENEQFKRAWRMYMSYLMQGHDVSGEGIGELLYNEMEYLYFNRKNQTEIKEQFVPKNENVFEFRNDVRIVVEWNTSEAEFDMEFVSPDKRAYVFEHTLAANQALISDEKTKGYSSKEFMIDDIGDGEWLVNFTYHGNKKPAPTYFKVDIFYHWGKPNQRKETTVYKFQNERRKIQLYRINKQMLLAGN